MIFDDVHIYIYFLYSQKELASFIGHLMPCQTSNKMFSPIVEFEHKIGERKTSGRNERVRVPDQ